MAWTYSFSEVNWINSGLIPKLPGVYKIYNNMTGDFYIGSSTNLRKRFVSHRANLLKNGHSNPHLQSSFSKWGSNNFFFSILLFCEETFSTEYEQNYVEILKPIYNKRTVDVSTNRGVVFSLEHNKRIREKRIGTKHTEATKRKMRVSRTGHPPYKVRTFSEFVFISPSGERFYNVSNLKTFCEKYAMKAKHFCALLVGKAKHYHGWSIEYVES